MRRIKVRYWETGASVRENLQSSDSFLQGVAIGYVLGCDDAREIRLNVPPGRIRDRYRLPHTCTREELGKIVENYLERHPDQRPERAILLVYMALEEAFPVRA